MERPTHSPSLSHGEVAALKSELWRRGELRWKLHPDQLAVYQQAMGSPSSRFVMEISRKWGKTFLLALIAVEACLRNPGGRVVYGAPSLKHLEEFVLPAFRWVVDDAPPDCRPIWKASKGHWLFPNGANVQLFGAEDERRADRGRGPSAIACIFDEAGFTPVLKYVLSSIFRAQLMHTRGRTFLGSTPAKEPEHDFTEIAARAESKGYYARRTIYDNPLLTPEAIDGFVADSAEEEGYTVEEFEQTDVFRREYLAERVVDRKLVVVPEWADRRGDLFVAVDRPEFFNGMTVLDPGGADPHAVHFSYWHPKIAKWVIEDELLLRRGENTAELVQAMKGKETDLWGVRAWEGTLRGVTEAPTDALLACLPDWLANALDKAAPTQPFTRWCDTNLTLARDLHELHGMSIIPTAKDDLQLQVNNLRVMVRKGEVLVHPRCKHTDRHLRATAWENHKRKTFKRRGGEHGDLVATLIYGARNLDRRDPMPANWDLGAREVPSRRAQRAQQEEQEKLARAFLGRGPLAEKLLAGRRR